jgi:hypothetical protein
MASTTAARSRRTGQRRWRTHVASAGPVVAIAMNATKVSAPTNTPAP